MTKILIIYMNYLLATSFISIFMNSIPTNDKKIHPLKLIFILFLMNIFMCLNISMTYNNQMFSYLTFLIIIGGMMILFMYFVTFINNLNISFNWMNIKNMMMKTFLFVMALMFMINSMKFNLPWMFLFNEIMNLIFLNKENLLNNNTNIMYMCTMKKIIY